MRPIRLLVYLLVLAACTDGGAGRRAYLQSFVGRPETDLVRELGVPSRSYDADGRRFLAYDERRLDVSPASFFAAGLGGWSGPGGFFGAGYYAGSLPPDIVERRCETTFEVAGSTVRSWQLRGNSCS